MANILLEEGTMIFRINLMKICHPKMCSSTFLPNPLAMLLLLTVSTVLSYTYGVLGVAIKAANSDAQA